MRLALVNVKGGVGKTTTAVNLAAAFARSGLRVLVVDLDPQGSATWSFGVPRDQAEPSSAGLLTGKAEAADAIRPTGVEGIDLIPASLKLAGLDLALARKQDPEKQLKKALSPVRRRYDVIVFDCPPGLSILSLNGLGAANAFLVPVAPHHLDQEALSGFLEPGNGRGRAGDPQASRPAGAPHRDPGERPPGAGARPGPDHLRLRELVHGSLRLRQAGRRGPAPRPQGRAAVGA